MATLGLNLDEQKAVDRFRTGVIEPSMTALVILDFWAEWCGPCKALSPMLEKVAADFAEKGVILAKIDVDAEPFIATQFQVRSIPTVYAMYQGQPVADLTSARSESQLKAMLDQLLEKLAIKPAGGDPVQDIAPLLAMGDTALKENDGARAVSIFSQIAEIAPTSAAAHAGWIRALVLAGDLAQAQAVLAAIPEDIAADVELHRAGTALQLALDKPADNELDQLRQAALDHPADPERQLAYATAAFATGERDIAADVLLAMIAADRAWNDGAARAKLLQIFEAVGLEDPWVSAMRRRLSTILFG